MSEQSSGIVKFASQFFRRSQSLIGYVLVRVLPEAIILRVPRLRFSHQYMLKIEAAQRLEREKSALGVRATPVRELVAEIHAGYSKLSPQQKLFASKLSQGLAGVASAAADGETSEDSKRSAANATPSGL
jgi:hypothetical protein